MSARAHAARQGSNLETVRTRQRLHSHRLRSVTHAEDSEPSGSAVEGASASVDIRKHLSDSPATGAEMPQTGKNRGVGCFAALAASTPLSGVADPQTPLRLA